MKSTIGKTGYQISKVGLGTVQFGIDYGFTKKKTQEEVEDILSCAKKNGINFIDTAREYGDSEEKIGRFISENSNEFIIATKLKKISEKEILNDNQLKDYIYKSVEESMKYLKQQKIDILQLHQTDDYLVTNVGFWSVVEKLKAEKIIGAFGVSVYDEIETTYLVDHFGSLVDFFQVPYNIFDRRFAALEDIFLKHGIGVVSRSTFLKGVIPCSLNKIPKGLEELATYKIKLNKLAEGLSLEVEELALLFVYYNELITCTLLGVDSSRELEANISVIDKYNRDILINQDFSGLAIENLRVIDPRKWTNF